MEKYLPKMYKSLINIYNSIGTENEETIIRDEYELIEGISVDFGIMQKTRKAYVIKSDFGWDDIGSFASLARFLGNFRGNNVEGNAFMEQSENCCVISKDKLIIGFGIKDLIIVDSGDVILIMDKNRDQEIKSLVTEIKNQGRYDGYL
ncbi:MAG: mannose-6-phosphate isomerase [Bacillota bacterium]|nr:mannose-6-phosphate isomerase [Bacillota bacterium]